MRRTIVLLGLVAAAFLTYDSAERLVARQPATSPTSQPAPVRPAPPLNDTFGVEALSNPVAGGRSPRNANYAIDVRLEPRFHRLIGSERVTWRNITFQARSDLVFHLYYNAWRNTRSTWLREELLAGPADLSSRQPEDWGSIEITSIALIDPGAQGVDLTGRTRFVAPDTGNPDDRTVMVVSLPRLLPINDTVMIEVKWTSRIPRTFARTGAIDDYFFIAQWFPKVAVLQETGWNAHEFHAGTEFFADYGVYDVNMTVPAGWVVGATGVEQRRRDNGDGTVTHAYHQEDVHDFAWTTSPNFVERMETFEHPRLPSVRMRLLLQPEHAGQAERHFAATRAALRYYGEWFGPYPYGHITVVDPAWQSGSGGMEYPTLFTAGTRWLAPDEVHQPESVTIHEAGHQFWYGIVGNNEFEDAWLDEGFNSFATARVEAIAFPPERYSRRFFGAKAGSPRRQGFLPWVFHDIVLSRDVEGNGLDSYRSAAESDAQSTPSFRYWPETGAAISYDKTALWLHTLERMIGWPTLQRVMATFFERWKFKHPKPADFFAVATEVSGRNLSWFFDQVYNGSNTFDYGVERFTSARAGAEGYFGSEGSLAYRNGDDKEPRYVTTVVVRRYGEAVFPVDVMVVFENGEAVRTHWNGQERWRQFTYERASRGAYAHVDPDRVLLLDVNYTNNSMTLTPKGPAAATKWTLKWMVWLQDLMMTYAYFV